MESGPLLAAHRLAEGGAAITPRPAHFLYTGGGHAVFRTGDFRQRRGHDADELRDPRGCGGVLEEIEVDADPVVA